MKTSNILVAGIIGGIVAFLLGFLTYGTLLNDYFSSQSLTPGMMKPDEELMFIPLVVGHLTLGLLLSVIFGRWASISTMETGAKAGAVIGLLMALSYSLISLATTNTMTTTGHLADIALQTVNIAITGAAVAWYLGRDK